MPGKDHDKMPNLIVWSWMREVLGLHGTQLLIFSYMFTQCFDSVHQCTTSLSSMEKWFGVTRQAVSRNIDKLVDSQYLYKVTESDRITPMIKHNVYRINMKYITGLCEDSDYESYENFIQSYSYALKSVFPAEGAVIDEYLDQMLQWHKTKDIKVCITLNELVKEIYNSDTSELNLSDVLRRLSNTENEYVDPFNQKPVKTIKKKEKVESKKVDNKLFDTPKAKGTRKLRNEWIEVKKEMNQEFVTLNANNNDELLELLNNFLETTNGRSYTPTQWQNQLDSLYTNGRTTERMIQGVRISYMNNYRSLYLVDKSEVDIPVKLAEIDAYICKEENKCSQELKKWLSSYVTEVPKGKSCTANQFRLMLEDLSDICKTLDDKIESVKKSYTNSYSALAYRSTYGTTQTEDDSIDMTEKEILVHKFIVDGYYQLCDGLEDSLMSYIHDTNSGKTMTKDVFNTALCNLRLFCFKDEDKINSVNLSIQKNRNVLAVENFNETASLKKKGITREMCAVSFDNTRRTTVEKAKRKNPNDERLKDVDLNKSWAR